MKNLFIALITLSSASAYAGVVESTIATVEAQHQVHCGSFTVFSTEPFHKEVSRCTNASGKVTVQVETEDAANLSAVKIYLFK